MYRDKKVKIKGQNKLNHLFGVKKSKKEESFGFSSGFTRGEIYGGFEEMERRKVLTLRKKEWKRGLMKVLQWSLGFEDEHKKRRPCHFQRELGPLAVKHEASA